MGDVAWAVTDSRGVRNAARSGYARLHLVPAPVDPSERVTPVCGQYGAKFWQPAPPGVGMRACPACLRATRTVPGG